MNKVSQSSEQLITNPTQMTNIDMNQNKSIIKRSITSLSSNTPRKVLSNLIINILELKKNNFAMTIKASSK